MATVVSLSKQNSQYRDWNAMYTHAAVTPPRVAYRGRRLPPMSAAPNTYTEQSCVVPPPADPYDVLGVSRTATLAQLKRAYRAQMRRFHPDLHPEATVLLRAQLTRWAVALNRAYDTLIAPVAE